MSTLCRHLSQFFLAGTLFILGPIWVTAEDTRNIPVACQGLDRVTIYAAASLGPALNALNELLIENGGPELHISLASSAVLARQIENGAPADIFLSADERWVAYLGATEKLRPDAPIALAQNQLVLAVRGNQYTKWEDWTGVIQDPGLERIATGDPANVPLGQYAKEALETVNLWELAAPKLIPALDARAALAFFESGAVNAAILYASDLDPKTPVWHIYAIPQIYHSPINYWVSGPKNGIELHYHCLVNFLSGPESREILRQYGFQPL